MRSVGSLFSGVGGFELGFERAGFETAWQVEIDKDAISVLERHWPTVTRYRDVREVDPADLEPVDVVTFGSPCQDFSVAGKRAGLGGERSGLFGEAIRIIRGVRPAFAVWENVFGALSSAGGRDFGAVLDALADVGALDISWRVLDARFWGVAQRRRRIFLVADFRAERAASVLFEPARGGRDSEACREAGQGTAGDAEDGAGSVGLSVAAEGGNRTSGPIDVATARNAHPGPHGRLDFESETLVVSGTVRSHPRPGSNSVGNVVAHAVSASAGHHGHSSPRGDGSDNLIPTLMASGSGTARPGGQAGETDFYVPVAFSVPHAECDLGDQTACLQAGTGETGNMLPAVLYGTDWQQDGSSVEDGSPTLTTTRVPGDAGHADMAVRRLTPTECCRLMGWPDDHVRYRADGSLLPDGTQYRLIGNGVVAPVAEWLGRRLMSALDGMP